MANYEATRYNWDGAYLTGVQGVNTGIIIPWSSASIPSGFLECNGQSVSTTTYAALFAVIGYTYGGSGASFLVPDLRDNIAVGKSNTKTLASTGGANTVTPAGNVTANAGQTTLTVNQIPSHTHSYNAGGAPQAMSLSGGMSSGNYSATSGNAGGGLGHNHSIASISFTGSSQSVLQPYITLIYIIKT